LLNFVPVGLIKPYVFAAVISGVWRAYDMRATTCVDLWS